MARTELPNGVILPAEYSDDWYDDMTSNLTKLDDVIGSDSEKLSSADVGAAALSNNYNDLDNLPTIPTVNDATLTIQKNGVDVQTFTANASSNVTANITVPTKTSDLINDSNFVDTSNAAVSSGITSAKVTDYDTHIADTDIHVTTADKATWNTVTSKANDSDVVHKSGDETINGNKTFSSNVNVYNSDSSTDTANIILKNSKAERGSTTNIGEQNISFVDKNNNQLGQIKCEADANGYSQLTLQCSDINDTSSGVQVRKTSTGFVFRPTNDNQCWLGQRERRWYNTYTSKINGLEPSSLSLPSDRSARIDISSYFTDTSNGGVNRYTAPSNGFVYLVVTDVVTIHLFSQDSGRITNYGDTRGRATAGQLYAFLPVRKGDVFTSQWYTTATNVTLTSAYFIPCQGNV